MSTRNGPGERAIPESLRDHLGRIRRMVVTLTTRPLWQVLGHLLLDGTKETHDAEAFTGIGFYSRPPSSGKPEAIVVYAGEGARSPLVAALRDEKTRAAVFALAGALAEDETALYNSVAIVRMKPDGTIEARSIAGAAIPLATKADIDALKAWAATHTHPTAATGPASPPSIAPPNAVGTTKFKAE